MVRTLNTNEDVMKTFFDVQTLLGKVRDSLRNSQFFVPVGVSVDSLYEILIEIFDTIVFIRRHSEKLRVLTPGIKEVNASFENVGGLAKVTFKRNAIPMQKGEQLLLDAIREDLILLKRELISQGGRYDYLSLEHRVLRNKLKSHVIGDQHLMFTSLETLADDIRKIAKKELKSSKQKKPSKKAAYSRWVRRQKK